VLLESSGVHSLVLVEDLGGNGGYLVKDCGRLFSGGGGGWSMVEDILAAVACVAVPAEVDIPTAPPARCLLVKRVPVSSDSAMEEKDEAMAPPPPPVALLSCVVASPSKSSLALTAHHNCF